MSNENVKCINCRNLCIKDNDLCGAGEEVAEISFDVYDYIICDYYEDVVATRHVSSSLRS